MYKDPLSEGRKENEQENLEGSVQVSKEETAVATPVVNSAQVEKKEEILFE